jgi:hypothetical protein
VQSSIEIADFTGQIPCRRLVQCYINFDKTHNLVGERAGCASALCHADQKTRPLVTALRFGDSVSDNRNKIEMNDARLAGSFPHAIDRSDSAFRQFEKADDTDRVVSNRRKRHGIAQRLKNSGTQEIDPR